MADKSRRRAGHPGVTVTALALLLLVLCLAEGATEQRINSRGNKASNLIEKVNGWRSQRGGFHFNRMPGKWTAASTCVPNTFTAITNPPAKRGSCLSYGHSCWGAHGKRSGKPLVTAPDWFLTKLFRRMDSNSEMPRTRQSTNSDDVSAIYQGEAPDDSHATDQLGSDEGAPLDLSINRSPEAKPMLDEDLISKIKLWQIMREVSEQQN